jgi:hypothetical protein
VASLQGSSSEDAGSRSGLRPPSPPPPSEPSLASPGLQLSRSGPIPVFVVVSLPFSLPEHAPITPQTGFEPDRPRLRRFRRLLSPIPAVVLQEGGAQAGERPQNRRADARPGATAPAGRPADRYRRHDAGSPSETGKRGRGAREEGPWGRGNVPRGGPPHCAGQRIGYASCTYFDHLSSDHLVVEALRPGRLHFCPSRRRRRRCEWRR